ncbi:MAG TPA: hypothetical protein VK569_05655 [Bacteroidota bacterium]|nr:hypothetical protein [Bacteroidota bacterium]
MAAGQTVSATQRIVMEVKPVTRLVVSGAPSPLLITAGGGGGSVTDRASRYSLVTNIGGMRIAASIDRPMPSGTSLAIMLESSRGTSRGEVDITGSTVSTDVVAGIRPGSERDQTITYRFSALPGIADLASQERTVTLTLTD